MGSQLSWLEHTPDKREVDGPSPFEPTKVLFRTEYGLKRASKGFGLRKSGHMIAKQSYGQYRFEQDGKASTVVEDFEKINNCIAR